MITMSNRYHAIGQTLWISNVKMLVSFLCLINFWGGPTCQAMLAKERSNYSSIAYDHRALLIDGERRLLISGSIHYPRSTPQMWPNLIQLAKDGGLDVIQTYVFWDGHEPQRGKYYFDGRYDLVNFLKLVNDAGLYANLRIGPYVCAERNFGGLPEWLREIADIEFRTDNELFKAEMQIFVNYVVSKMKENNLFYNQGGPIILTQVENEYGMIEAAYGDAGAEYTKWAGNMAIALDTSVPWIMCKQPNAPGAVIDTCNGFYCDDYTPNAYDKPKMWTENWSGWFHYWGISRPNRPVEDLAYATARFFQKGGSFMNYYMYHGGTNFGRTSAAGVTTSYDYDAPIDEYGQVRQPKWGHLRDLHVAIKLCEPALASVDGDPVFWTVPGREVEIYVYSNVFSSGQAEELQRLRAPPDVQVDTDGRVRCAAFLSNSGMTDVDLELFGFSLHLPAWSVSISPDCRNVVFNTAQVVAQTSLKQILPTKNAEIMHGQVVSEMPQTTDTNSNHNAQSTEPAADFQGTIDESDPLLNATAASEEPDLRWVFARDVIGGPRGPRGPPILHDGLLEQITVTHDWTDYLWYTTTVNMSQHGGQPSTDSGETTLVIETVRDYVSVFLNDKPAGGYPSWNGTHFSQPLTLREGDNTISLLSAMAGLWYAGPFYEKEVGGLSGSVTLHSGGQGDFVDLTQGQWSHKVGLAGELLQSGPDSSQIGVHPGLSWSPAPLPLNEPLVWYKTMVETPGGDSPVVLDLGSMRKGQSWINGQHLGRYWPAMHNPQKGCDDECDYRGTYADHGKCVTECGQPSQRWYHVPREWLNPRKNILTLFEEIGGNVSAVSIATQVVHTVCSHISQAQPVLPLDPQETGPESPLLPQIYLDCGSGFHIERIDFASFGKPLGKCGRFVTGDCHAPGSTVVVEKACLGQQVCSLQVENAVAGIDPCPSQIKSLAVQAVCARLGTDRPAGRY